VIVMADLRGMPADLSRFYPPPPRLAPVQLKGGLGASDEHPFISGTDEPHLDPLMDAARLLEQTGERWLSFSEAVALLRERSPMSIGRAEKIIDDFRVAYFAGGGPFARQSGKSAPVRCYFIRSIGLLNEKPHRGNTFVNQPDLIDWHDRKTPKSAPSAPPPAPTPAPRTSKTQISKIVADYRLSLSSGAKPSITVFEQYARDNGVTGHRDELRAEYHRQFPNQRVGRPSK
jgi:hypothetical protein